jgi:hypothetical protein
MWEVTPAGDSEKVRVAGAEGRGMNRLSPEITAPWTLGGSEMAVGHPP